MKKYIRPIIAAGLFIAFMTAYMLVYEYVIYFHEQHHLFRFDAAYAQWTIHTYGLWYYLTEFVIQFGYHTWLGALVWSLMATGIYLWLQGAIRRLLGLRDLLQVSAIPAIWMFFCTTDVDTLPRRALMIFFASFALWLLAVAASKLPGVFRRRYEASLASSPKCKPWVAIGSIALVVVYGIVGYNLTLRERTITLQSGKEMVQDRQERLAQRNIERMMIEAERGVKEQDWDKVYKVCTEQAATGRRNHLMSYFRSMALYHKGMLLDHLLDYPQTFGVNSLYFPWKADRNRAEYGGYLYEQLGAVNSANHWAFEALVGWGETAWHLTNLARYAIAMGKDAQARKWIAPLKHTLFYRSQAADLERMLAQGHVDDGLTNSLANANSTPARWDNVINLGADARYILEHDPDNRMAREYLVAQMLLANNLGAFYRCLKEFWPAQQPGQRLPAMVEQALCLVRMQIGEAQLRADGFTISPETDQAFHQYMEQMQQGANARYSPDLRRTYWFYVNNISPYGHEIYF